MGKNKRQTTKRVTKNVASTAQEKLLHVLAAGIVATDELTDEEVALLQEGESGLTDEQRAEILKEVGDDPYLRMP